jgi:hypothetical protein
LQCWAETYNVATENSPSGKVVLTRRHHTVRVGRVLLETSIDEERVHAALPQPRLLIAHPRNLVS